MFLPLKSLEALGVLGKMERQQRLLFRPICRDQSLATTFKGIVEEQKVPAGKEVQK